MDIIRVLSASALLLAIIIAPVLTSAVEEEGHQDENVCISCHQEVGGEMAEPVGLWKTSIHYQMGKYKVPQV